MLVSSHLAINQLEVTRALFAYNHMIGGYPSNLMQGPIIHNLRLKQFRQISGNYCRALVAVAEEK